MKHSISILNDGGITQPSFTVNSSDLSAESISASGISAPKNALIFSGENGTLISFFSPLSISITPLTTLPQFNSVISSHALASAEETISLSKPFSYLPDDSVLIPSFCAVFLTEEPKNAALSNTIVFVSSTIPEYSPPITPATAIGFSLSQIASISGVSSCSTPSSVVIFSPARAFLTTISLPLTNLMSNACIG